MTKPYMTHTGIIWLLFSNGLGHLKTNLGGGLPGGYFQYSKHNLHAGTGTYIHISRIHIVIQIRKKTYKVAQGASLL